MKNNIAIALIVVLLGLLIPQCVKAQDTPSYNLEFVRAKYVDQKRWKDILVFFRISAKEKRKKDFPPVISMRVRYSLNDNSKVDTVDILNNDKKVNLYVLDKSVKYKSQFVYNLLSSKTDMETDNNFIILEFYLGDISDEIVKKMSFTYGLWEKNNLEVRHEKTFDFPVEK
jgi:hypothetical protein